MSVINFSARTVTDAASTTSQCAVLPLFNGAKLSDAAAQLDNASSGAITAALAVGDFTAASGQALMLPGHGKVKRLLLIGCGDQKKFDRSAVRSFCQQVYLALAKSKAKDATLHLAGLAQNADETRWMLSFFARQLTVSAILSRTKH
jgi:leucyl aminopeptidase